MGLVDQEYVLPLSLTFNLRFCDPFSLTKLQSLCNNCGLAFERDKRLPPWAKHLHIGDQPLGRH